MPLEPRAAVAEWVDGKLTVWTGTQRPFGVRAELAAAFRVPEERVRVIVPDAGSAYGGKHSGEHAVEAARLAKAAGKPVKLVWTRKEEFSYGYFRPAGVIDIKAGVDAEGRLTSWEFDNWNSGGSAIRTPYEVPGQRIQFHASDSPLRQGSYRGLAATANHYAREMHMDAIARAVGVDAVEYRLRHLKDERMRAVLTAAAQKSGWPRPSAAGRGLGIACGTEKGSYVATAAEVSRAANGFTVERLVVVFECGAIVNPDGLNNQVEGSVIQGLGGALVRGDRVRRRRHRQRHHGALPRAALQGYPAHRDRSARSQGSAVGGSRGDADRVRRARHRIRGARVRHGGRGAARAVGVIVQRRQRRGRRYRIQNGATEPTEVTEKTIRVTQTSLFRLLR